MAQGLIQWLFLELISLLVGELEKEAGLLVGFGFLLIAFRTLP